MARRQISDTLLRIKESGSEAKYYSVDVRERELLDKVLSEVRTQWGNLAGVVHGAGVLADKKIKDKSLDQFRMVWSTKVDGLRNILELTQNDPLKVLILFSSVTARFGRPGQADYCMANEVLNKVAWLEKSRRKDCRVVSINWGPWDGGMVTSGLKREFEKLGVGLIPVSVGAASFVNELRTGDHRAAEVLLGDGFPVPGFREAGKGRKDRKVQANGKLKGRLLLRRPLSLKEFPPIDSHRLKGKPVLPVAMMMEWFSQAALYAQVGMKVQALKGLSVFKGVVLEDAGLRQLEIYSGKPKKNDGGVSLELQLRSEEKLHAQAEVWLVPELPPHTDRVVIPEGLAVEPYPYEVKTVYDEFLFHGPDFFALDRIEGWSDKGMVAKVRRAPSPEVWENQPWRSDWVLDPLVLDGALQLGVIWCQHRLKMPALPSKVDSLQLYRSFPAGGDVVVALKVNKEGSHLLRADIFVVDPDFEIIAVMNRVEWTADQSLRAAFKPGIKV